MGMLELRVVQPGEQFDWKPQREGIPPDTELIRRWPLGELQAMLGWKPRESKHLGAMLQEAHWTPPSSTYFADFGPSATSRYGIANDRAFTVLEQRMSAVYDPFVFIYPPHVSTTQVTAGGGTGLIVIPKPGYGVAAFAVWTHDDEFMQIIFGWSVTVNEASEILADLLSND